MSTIKGAYEQRHDQTRQGADPAFGWTFETTKQHFTDNPPKKGDEVLILNEQGGMEEYVLAHIVNPSLGRQGRILLNESAAFGGTTFYRSGKNCFSPKGQSRMLPPIPEVVAAIKEVEGRVTIHSNRHYGIPS